MGNIKVYFSDFFEIDEDIIEEYGAINISLINDLPLLNKIAARWPAKAVA